MKHAKGRIATLTLGLLLLLATCAASALASHELRDPFVADPLGPYSLLSNPASIYQDNHFVLRAGLAQGRVGSSTTQLVAYVEPDMGNGAGALYWYGGNLATGSKLREVGYVVSRKIANGLAVGLTLKHVKEDAMGTWATDAGVMTVGPGRIRLGLTVHNFTGATVLNPTRVTAGINFAVAPMFMNLSVAVRTAWMGEPKDMEAAVAVDIRPVSSTTVRVGRVVNIDTSAGYWFGGVKVDFERFYIDANIAMAGSDRRIMIGAVYRF